MSRPPGQPYRDGHAFLRALSARLKQHHAGPRYARALKVFAFTRLLDRIEQEFADAVILKGGMALELRLPGRARMTKDVTYGLSAIRPTSTNVSDAPAGSRQATSSRTPSQRSSR